MMVSSNDTRGWILTGISALACCFGASLICVDVFVRQIPGMRDFKITESDAFLSASLSLSAGVILFSSLYSMLPSSKTYLTNGGYSAKTASFALIGFFLLGVFGIRILSTILHRFIPSHIVDCDHTHDDAADKEGTEEMAEQGQVNSPNHDYAKSKLQHHHDGINGESTPLLSHSSIRKHPQRTTTAPVGSAHTTSQINSNEAAQHSVRPASNFRRTLSRTFSKYVSPHKNECDEDGPCMGFSDPCGQDCFKIAQRRGTQFSTHSASHHKAPARQRLSNDFRSQSEVVGMRTHNLQSSTDTEAPQVNTPEERDFADQTCKHEQPMTNSVHHYHHPEHDHEHGHDHAHHIHSDVHNHGTDSSEPLKSTDHHHHVPTNAFMSISLQTSVAIALHKAPEGFITFATNHVNPQLGFSIFIALFIHNITEGFALSLPLFLAFHSRFKAIVWASVLGGLSQPLGAGIAALWFKISDQTGSFAPNEKVYGALFAITSGVMASVALSLVSESLQLSHNKNTCIAFAFVGMGLLGVSTALTAK